jgi:2-amino-4-hydroxy-6-hydroxymethyldihydropteridine diphosphokinase
MGNAWLSLGANIGNPAMQLDEAVRRIDALPGTAVRHRSSVIATAPWGKTDQPDFLNMAIGVETDLPPLNLIGALLEIERTMGRQRGETWGPRLIDIDIVAYDWLEMQSDMLNLPHPHAHERDFVLGPLREIAPEVADWLLARAASHQG